ncbi:MAG: FKBP-type peptidyl-prolyl cis-trans isomerase [Bacteroidetes bacterium]|nr:MAG: FKBP-type peptidyl-prolyl cis-trans isomerase [Bacteroidota bacterium]
MKHKYFLLAVLAAVVSMTSCSNVDYNKTKSGLLYKIIKKGNSSDPIAKPGNVIKLHFVQKLNDSVLQSTFGKMPFFTRVDTSAVVAYSPSEILPLVRKGDSAVVVQMVDSLLNRGLQMQLPPSAKKGDRIIFTIKIVNVFTNDSLVQKDYEAEMKRDMPRQQKEMQEQMAKQQKLRKEQEEKEEEELRKSGEVDRELSAMENYLKTKKINAQKTGKGTFVLVKQQGNGSAANVGDSVTVKYTGKILATDSVFESGTYTFPLGQSKVIQGWDEGIKLFRKGGTGTLFVPGFLAYGRNVRPGSPFKPFDAMIFDVEIMDVKPNPVH